MSENDLNDVDVNERERRFRKEWLFPIFFQPRATVEKVVSQTKAVWLLPLVVLSVLSLLYVVVQGGPRKASAQMNTALPQDFQYYSEDMQNQVTQAFASQSSVSAVYILPGIGALAGVWLAWFLFGSLLYLSLTLAGSRSNNTVALNLVAWASMPYALRYLVRIIYVFASDKLIASAGLSGFIAAESSTFVKYLSAVLAQVDIYLIWALILVLLGVFSLSGLARSKAVWAVLAALVVGLLLAALPGFASALLGSFAMGGG